MSLLSNIHKIASSIIPMQSIEWCKWSASNVDQYGQVSSGYGTWTTVKGHVQPGIISSFGGKNISERDYKEMGLDWSKKYITVWIDGSAISTVANQKGADKIRLNGTDVYNVIQVADWLEFDGWKRCYCVEEMS